MLRTIAGTIPGHHARHHRVLSHFYSITAHGSRPTSRRINSLLPLKDLFVTVPGQGAPRGTAVSSALKDHQFFLASSRTLSSEGKPSVLSRSVSVMSLQRYSSVAWKPSKALPQGNSFIHSHSAGMNRWTGAKNLPQRQQMRSMSNQLQRFRTPFTIDSPNKLVYPIVAINIAVFGTWQYAEGNLKRFQDGRLYKFMFENFANSLTNLKQGRYWTLVTSSFSHKDWYHILLNTLVLTSFGAPVWHLLGTARFLTVYFGSAITSSLASVGYASYLGPYLRRIQDKPPANPIYYSLGASGAIMGITAAYACVNPFAQYSLFFVINMPAIVLIGLFGTYELYNVLTANTGQFDSASHLGGAMFGAGYYFTKLRPIIRRMSRR